MIEEERMVKALNYFLGEADVSLSEVKLVDNNFDIGSNIIRKYSILFVFIFFFFVRHYSYLILPNQPILNQKNIFYKKMRSWQIEEQLNIDKLRQGIEKFVGTYNFFNFTVKR